MQARLGQTPQQRDSPPPPLVSVPASVSLVILSPSKSSSSGNSRRKRKSSAKAKATQYHQGHLVLLSGHSAQNSALATPRTLGT